jgi:two-component system response regulator PilR (NtrC family)
MTASILVVDDMPEMQRMLNCSLASEGYRVATAGSGEEALARIGEQEFDLIVTDIVMPGLSGLEVLEKSQLLNPRAAVIMMTGYATLETAVTALRRGACDYLEKPLHLDELSLRVRRALESREAILRARLQQRALLRPLTVDTLVGESHAMRALLEQIARSARTPSNVLITGESGVGKELVARAIHGASPRCDRTFIAVNCGAIPEALLESQLFGHVRGAFTTAVQANPGLFMAANRGTLLLDEIGDLPFALQVKLLRVIEERQVWPVGATKPLPVDVRIIASTNRDLAREVEAGRFREDLFYRLHVVHLTVPPLRERRSDIPLLVDHLIDRLNAKLGARFLGIERDALWVLMTQPWKGNVRELENVLERAMVLGSGDLISLQHLSADATTADETRPHDLREALRRFERQHLMSVIAETRSDKRAAARLLGISLASLYRKLNLTPDDGPAPSRGE